MDIYRGQQDLDRPSSCSYRLGNERGGAESRWQVLWQEPADPFRDHVRKDERHSVEEVDPIVGVEALPPIPRMNEVGTFERNDAAKGRHHRQRRMVCDLGRRQETQSTSPRNVNHRPRCGKDDNLVAMQVPERRREIYDIDLRAPDFESMSEHKYLHYFALSSW
jgi:hypothetical protein